jgi:hypothetical protein
VPEAADAATAESAQAAAATAEVQAKDSVEVGEMQASPVAPEAAVGTEAEAAPAVAHEPPMAAASEAASEPADAFDAGDEAMLDIVAMEMAAPDTDAAYDPEIDEPQAYETQVYAQTHEVQVSEAHVSEAHGLQIDTPPAGKIEASAASYEIDVTFGSEPGDVAEESVVTTTALPIVTPLQMMPEPEAKAEDALSLGSSLLANGIVPRPRVSRPDPLAPIRRMSQNEKIAFFS